ncbi:M61 family metallopeptidase [Crenobacter cavernae]|uniref:M61 family peptidase n=1 Tax=Crenobacter cavernae TaxID=2290923 RepID=A0A345Y2D3_9NEIS|nr:PDZ domain-containing protein [Crenobacter cavernae]AXK38085.1 M61 family peptidase [Crenobacter cavernae]
MTATVRYTLRPIRPEAHLFEATLTVDAPDQAGQRFTLPAWIPGSYMIRDFARQIVAIRAESGGKSLALTQLDKHSWLAEPCKKALTVTVEVYAYDLSVRGAYLDSTRGFFNGTSVFLRPEGLAEQPCTLDIQPPEGKAFDDWTVATSLAPLDVKKRTGFGRYGAAGYDELIDHPFELGGVERVTFKACGVPHEIVVSGRHRGDLKRLARDAKKICEYQIRLFGEPAPFERYVFLLYVGGDVYGGLEHRASTALVANRDDLPVKGDKSLTDGYLQLLGLISHEYFHSWNVKRIKPAAFTPYELSTENYTRLLWAFEGVTSYYDDLTLVRSGLIDKERYLQLLAKTITAVERGAGRRKQTLEESSFTAWNKYYRQDENSPNAIVSYYAKGALAALALDLFIREESGGVKSLDDVMCALWSKWLSDGQGLAEHEWEAIAEAVTGLDLADFFASALRSTEDLPLAKLLATQGVTLSFDAAASASDRGGLADSANVKERAVFGAKTAADPLGVKLTQVFDGGAAQAAGLSGGDVLVAIDHLKASDFDKQLARYAPGDKITVHYFRRDELASATLELAAAPTDTARLALAGDAAWLHR